MKKILSLLIVIATLAMALVGCGAPEDDGMRDYKLSIGVALSENLASAKVTQTVASIVTDSEGKIVLCRLDCVDYTAYKNGAIVEAAPASKVSIGAAYGTMPAGSWDVQAKFLETHVVGKTQSEVAAISLIESGEEAGKLADAELKASCSINVVDLLKSIDNAFKSQHKISFTAKEGTLTAGLSAVSSVKNIDGDVTLSTNYAVAVMSNGAVAAAILDTAEPKLEGVGAEGAASLSFDGTKRELGDNYGSMPAGAWYVQADVFAKSVMGKTASEVAAISLIESGEDVGRLADAELKASCSIIVVGYKAGIEAAIASAR